MKHFVHATVHNTVLLPYYNGDTIGMFSLLAAEKYTIASPFPVTTGPIFLIAYERLVSELLFFTLFPP